MIPIVRKLTMYATYEGHEHTSWRASVAPAGAHDPKCPSTLRISSVAAIAKTPSAKASEPSRVHPVSARSNGSSTITGIVRDVGVGRDVVVPVGVGGRPTFGREDDEPLAVGEVGERCRPLRTGPCSSHREEQKRTALEV